MRAPGMLPATVCLALSACIPFTLSAKAEGLVTKDEAKKRAQAEMAKLIPGAANVRAVVYDEDVTAHRIRVIFDMYYPKGYWGTQARPEAYVDRRTGRVSMSAWSDTDAEKLPHPQTVTQRFLQSLGGRPTDPERAVRLIRRWLTVHRDSDAYEAHLDWAYGHFVRCFQEAKNEKEVESVLAEELAATKNPKAIYAIHRQRALHCQRGGENEKAVQSWKQAAAAVKGGAHAYFTTRQAMPLFEIGKIYLAGGNDLKAIEYLDAFCKSDYGKKNGSGAVKLLGELYEQRGEADKAIALYQAFVNEPHPGAVSPKHIESIKKPFREKLDQLRAKRSQKKD